MNKKILKKLLGIFIFYSGLFYALHTLIELFGRRRVVILMYHRILNNNPGRMPNSRDIRTCQQNFDSQMEYLSNKYDIITFDEFLDCCKNKKILGKNSIIITFDDGYKDNYDIAYPILKKYNLPATIFLTTGHIGSDKPFWWDKIDYVIHQSKFKKVKLEGLGAFSLVNKEKVTAEIQERVKKKSEADKNYIVNKLVKKLDVRIPKAKNLFLSWKDVKIMSKNNISFGAHTFSHPILTKVSAMEARKEIIKSKKKIEKEINRKVTVFAYPNGGVEDMSEDIDKFLKENGFHFALSTIYGANKPKIGAYRLKRIGIGHDDGMCLFRIKILGIGEIFRDMWAAFK